MSVPIEKIRDPARLSALRRLNLLDTPAEAAFDWISRLATTILDVPVALVSLVDGNRQFFKSCIGLSEPYSTWRETPLSSSFCKHVVVTSEPLILADARKDRFHRVNGAIEELGAVAYMGFPLQHDGQVLGSFCVIDKKEHRWTEKEISIVRDLASAAMTEIELRARSEELTVALRSREKMLAIISHDLRSPLQSIRTSTALMELKELDDESRECLQTTRKAVTRMHRMIRDLLDAGTLEFDSRSVAPEPLNVSSVLEEVRTSVALAAAEKEVTLDFECIQPCTVLADRDRLLQVLYNLLDNALRLTPAGGSIRAVARSEDGEIEFRVSDTGPGIPDENLSRVFDWSWHADHQDNGGTGLGLSIAKAIVLAHGGRISACNGDQGGATFIFTLVDAAAE